jgi:molybdopterin synthase catalytic subunit
MGDMEHRDETVWLSISSAPLDESASMSFLRTPAAGGINVFVGTTRRWTDGQETVRLEYECYEGMALQEMQRLVEAAQARWPVQRVCVLHRVGVVPPAQASVLVGVATPHRAEAFAACRFLIDTLKERVPIWKREVYSDGTTTWVEGSRKPNS